MSNVNRSVAYFVSGAVAAGLLAASAAAQVFPTGANTGYNFIPFGANQTDTMHQVFLNSLFGGSPVRISEVAYASNPGRIGQQVDLDVTIRMGYTNRAPGGLSSNLPDNPVGAMTQVYTVTNRLHTNASTGPDDFDLVFVLSTPFDYNPAQNNLLIEFEVTSRLVNGDCSISTNNAGTESSRAWTSTRFAPGADSTAARTRFVLGPVVGIQIALQGSCPGTMRLSWSGAPAGRPAGIAIAGGTGNFVIPGGPCAGTQTGLNNTLSLLTPPGVFNTGPNGSGSFSGNAGPNACRRFLQMFVVGQGAPPCGASNVIQIQ